jgi:hypothetical protein
MICPYFKSPLFEILGCRVLFWVVLSSRNGLVRNSERLLSILVQRNGIPSCVLFRGMVWNGIPRICIYFASKERNSELFPLPQKGSEQNYGSLLLFLFHGTEFRVVFSSAEEFGTEFRDFLFRGTIGIPSEITISSVYSVLRGIIFLLEIPNPGLTIPHLHNHLWMWICLQTSLLWSYPDKILFWSFSQNRTRLLLDTQL